MSIGVLSQVIYYIIENNTIITNNICKDKLPIKFTYLIRPQKNINCRYNEVYTGKYMIMCITIYVLFIITNKEKDP